jgi:hypothetical protein
MQAAAANEAAHARAGPARFLLRAELTGAVCGNGREAPWRSKGQRQSQILRLKQDTLAILMVDAQRIAERIPAGSLVVVSLVDALDGPLSSSSMQSGRPRRIRSFAPGATAIAGQEPASPEDDLGSPPLKAVSPY